ncbi:TrbG/VirB9 family P-type conjugative transfer protein [Bordetella hinzii]|nr:TrbG/VirB9 family P-type conjugative transfer protein [Bordetella hinzii]
MRSVFSMFVALLLSGCQAASSAHWRVAPDHFDFNWQLSGDPEVAPLQVFAGGQEIWLQFAPGQELPAIFGQAPAGEQPLAYQRRDPYVVLPGQWRALVLRGGRQVAYARRAGEPAPLAPDPEVLRLPPPDPPAAVTPAPPSAAAPAFFAGPPDTTLRAVLARWAAQAGWTFSAEHWALNADIPLQGQARFEGEFKTAVRELLRATELADRPLQPCFYANQVLRVVPLAQSCDRSRGAAA